MVFREADLKAGAKETLWSYFPQLLQEAQGILDKLLATANLVHQLRAADGDSVLAT